LFDFLYEGSVIGEPPSIQDPVHTLQEPPAVARVREADVTWLIEEGWPSPSGEIAERTLSRHSQRALPSLKGRVPDVRGAPIIAARILPDKRDQMRCLPRLRLPQGCFRLRDDLG
jgi:hypothetical protein